MAYNHNNLSEEDLEKLSFQINSTENSPKIEDVYYKKLQKNVDERGDLTELWSKPWSNNEPVAKDVEHVYFNTTHKGVVKGWHVHERTSSQYTCVLGKMQVVLIDVRKDSPTYLTVDKFVIGSVNPSFIKIPPGVLKAWKSLEGDSIIVNLLTSADMTDNFKYDWKCILQDIWM